MEEISEKFTMDYASHAQELDIEVRKVLLTSVCRPLGEKYGHGPSVGYELLHAQVTRAQGLFSPRSLHVSFGLEYIAENIDVPTTVLQYPSKREFIGELKCGHDLIGISFVLGTFNSMKEQVELIRKYSPHSKIVLGGYGTVLSDETLLPLADFICREEGVGFMRRVLGQPEKAMPYSHPTIVNPLTVFGRNVSRTGVVFGGLGCPHGCDFCCTSHFFRRKHIRLLPTGADIYAVVQRYMKLSPEMTIIILDEDFLLNRKRAFEFRDCVVRDGKALSIFCFASVKAVSMYTVTEILEMGIDGIWIGYEGTRSGFEKQSGRPVEEIFTEFREHGITILASMIVGFDYQTPEIIEEELSGLLALKPCFNQFLIYGPVPGTPFFDRVAEQGLLVHDVRDDPVGLSRKASGFDALVKHPSMSGFEIEKTQRTCFEQDFKRLGPSIFRCIETWLLGHLKLRDSDNPILLDKARMYERQLRDSYPVFLAGRLFGPTREVRRWIGQLQERIHSVIGRPTLPERFLAVAGVGLAAATGTALKLGWFQHPKLIRHTYGEREGSSAESV